MLPRVGKTKNVIIIIIMNKISFNSFINLKLSFQTFCSSNHSV